MTESAWDRDFGALEYVQDRQPAPTRQPGPTVVPMPTVPQARAPRQKAPSTALDPMPPEPVAPATPEPPAIPAEPQKEWGDLMRKHAVPAQDWGGLVDRTYSYRDNPGLESRTPIDADLKAFAKKYPDIGKEGFWEPKARPPSAVPAPAGAEAPQTAPAAPAPSGGAWDKDFGRVEAAPAAPPPQKVADPNAEPDAPTWLGRRIQDVRGKQDPRYAKIPNIARVLQDEGEHSLGGELASWTLGASDKDMAKTYQAMLGRRYVGTEQDANGYPIIVYKGKDGSEQRAYVNTPGLDAQDVARGGYGSLPFMAAGKVATSLLKGAPLLGRMFGQAGAQGAASVAQDAAAAATGVSDIDVGNSAVKAALAAGFGAGGEALGAAAGVYAKHQAAKRLAEGGRLTPEGVKAAKEAGIDPGQITGKLADEFAEAFARSGDAQGALKEITSKEWGIPRTVGELTGNKNQLLREQQYRGGTYGDTARTRVEQFDKRQSDAITNAIEGEIKPGKPGLYGQVAPARAGEKLNKGDIGGNIRANTEAAYEAAKESEKQAWSKVGRVDATEEALAELPNAVAAKTRDVLIDEAVTPMAAKMAKRMDDFMAGKSPAKAADILSNTPAGDVNTMRKRLLAMYQNAATSEDKRAARALYEAYNDWIPVAAERAGDFETATAMRIARGISREVHEAFDGQAGTPAARIMAQILRKADSPELIVNEMLSAPGKSELRSGSRQVTEMLFKAYDKYLSPEAAEVAKGDIRLAFLHRALNMKTGEVMTPGKMQTALKTMRENQASLYNYLFAEPQRKSLLNLERAMEGIEKKNPNTSWSAIGAGAMMRDLGKALYTFVGGNSVTGKIIGTGLYNRVEKTLGGVRASQATGNGMGAQLPALPAPSYGGFGGAYGASRSDSK